MKKEQKRLFKILNAMNEDGKPTKVIKKTLARLIGSKDAADWWLGTDEDPAIMAAMTGTVRLAYGLMGQIEEMESKIHDMECRMDLMRTEIEYLRSKKDSEKTE